MNTEMQRRLFAPLVRGLVVCLLGYSGLAAAGAITEVEPNDSISSAQSISVPPEGLTISAAIGLIGGGFTTDVDFFTFDATAGDFPSLTIVGAMKPDCTGFPSNIALFDSVGNLLGQSTSSDCPGADASISNVTLQATGKYVVAVSAYTHYFDQGGVVENADMAPPGGSYQLVISGVHNPAPAAPPSVKHVPIEVRHWHQDERDLGKRDGRDPITVAILSMADFDAMTVDANSLTFGATGNEKSLFRCLKEGKDINRDGLVDMVCYFKPDVASFQTGDLNGVLKGKTTSGQTIIGKAALKIFSMPTERRGFKHHGDRDDRRDDDDRRNR
jgi:hypothetical protein